MSEGYLYFLFFLVRLKEVSFFDKDEKEALSLYDIEQNWVI